MTANVQKSSTFSLRNMGEVVEKKGRKGVTAPEAGGDLCLEVGSRVDSASTFGTLSRNNLRLECQLFINLGSRRSPHWTVNPLAVVAASEGEGGGRVARHPCKTRWVRASTESD